MRHTDEASTFWARVQRGKNPDDCWLWLRCKSAAGYGVFKYEKKNSYAHRWSYQLLIGKIPKDLELDHLCRIRHCVNPAHLEPVTHAENCRRGRVGAHNAEKTHCKNGHPLDDLNTYAKAAGGRDCRTCRAVRGAEKRRRTVVLSASVPASLFEAVKTEASKRSMTRSAFVAMLLTASVGDCE